MPHSTASIELDTISPAPPSPVRGRPDSISNPFELESKTLATSIRSAAAASDALESTDDGPARRLEGLNIGGEGEAGAQELPPVDRGRHAWAFVAAAFFLETFIWGYSYSSATILVYLQRHEPWSSHSLSSLSAIGAVQLGVQFCLPLAVIVFFRRYPDWVKSALWTSLVINCGSMLLSSWSTKLWQLIVLQGVVCGASSAVLYAPVLSWLNDWFVQRKGLAGGIIFAGTGVGGLVFPFLISKLLEKYGFAWMIRAWSIITAVVFSVAVYFIRPRIPPRRLKGAERGPWLAVDVKLLWNPMFSIMALASILSSLSTFPVTLYLASYASNLTTSTFIAEVVVGVFNATASLGCAVTGWVSDYDYPLAVSICGAAGALIAVTAWGLADSLAKTYGFAVLFGFTSQMIASWGGTALDVSNGNPYTATVVFGLLSFVRGVASIVMPFVSQGLYRPDHAGTEGWGRFGFSNMIIFVGVTAFLSAVAGVALGWVRRQKVKQGVLKRQTR